MHFNSSGENCRDSILVTVVNLTVPASPGTITGPTDVCASIGVNTIGSPQRFYIRKMSSATSYYWSTPPNAILLNGQGDTAVSIAFNQEFVSGAITVSGINICGVSTVPRSLTVYKRSANTPGTIQKQFYPSVTAVTSVCGINSEVYKIKKVTYSTGYLWSFKMGTHASIVNLNASGLSINDTTVQINFLQGFTKDTLCVRSLNDCSISNFRTIVLSAIVLPPAVTSIISSTGNFAPCIGETVSYSATSNSPTIYQAPIINYRWTVPKNSVIIASNADSSIIFVQYNTGFIGGSIVAKGQSLCGIIGSAKTQVLQYLPPTPTIINASINSNNACIGDVINYTLQIPAPNSSQRAAIKHRWSIPSYTTIISANNDSSSIFLQFNTGYRGGTLAAKGETICGALGSSRSISLTHSLCPSGYKQAYLTEKPLNTFSKIPGGIIFPNPAKYDFTIKMFTQLESKTKVDIVDVKGRNLKSYLIKSSEPFSFGKDLLPGVYFIRLTQEKSSRILKIIKL